MGQNQPSRPESRSLQIWLVCAVGIAIVVLTALRSLPQIDQLLLDADGDDQMRLLQVRDWLAGQSWFDTRQYRILPPEGISMHWSRYLDAGIAAVLSAASLVLPGPSAELATVILWPSLLACLMVLMHAQGTNRLMGASAAIGALAVFLSWGKLGGEFVPPRIDHHNVQILCSTALFYLALVPGRARVLGALGGVATAAALAIGLEMLPFLATIWGLMALRHAFGQPQTGDWLLGFGAAFVLTAPLLMAGQTPVAAWTTAYCDVLALPVMVLGGIGVVATLTPVLLERVLTGPIARIAVLLTLTALGIWLAFPLLGQCLAGPYSNVTPAVRAIIEGNVKEALSAATLLSSDPGLLARVLLPPLVLTLFAAVTAWLLRGRIGPVLGMALLQAFVVVAVGTGFALVQIRAANLMTPAVPLLGGFLVHAFTLIPRTSPMRLPAVLVLLLALPTVVEKGATLALSRQAMAPGPAMTAGASGPVSDCRTRPAMAELASLPPSTLFSTLNLGPTIVAFTPHSATSAGYHRNPEAFWNGIGAFETAEILRGALVRSRADYLVLCANGSLERTSPLLRAILGGELPAWLADVTEGRKLMRVYQVDKAALGAQDGQP